MEFLLKIVICTLIVVQVTSTAVNYELDVKKFIDDASARYYILYDKIAEETYASIDDEDFETIFSKLTTVKRIATELVKISQEAISYDFNKINDANLTMALQNLRKVGGLFVLGEDYFSTVLINIAALRELSTDKDIEPYLNGAKMPDQDNSPLAYYPDIHKIFKSSNDSDELKYYWDNWREKNLLWSSVNFYTIVESFQQAAKLLDVPVLEFWFRSYSNKNFLHEMEKVIEEMKPLYDQLHAFVREELKNKYGSEIIDINGPIPDHLFEQVLEQAWSENSVIESYFPFKNLPRYDDIVADFGALEMIKKAELFYTSLGFETLGEEFLHTRLKQHDETMNTGDCTANIFDLTPHVYMKYCKEVSFRKFVQNHGYLGRIYYAKQKKNLPAYYFNSYDLEYPVGEAVILSATAPKHLTSIGLTKDFKFTEAILMNRLFRMGIHTILNMPLFFLHTKVINDLLEGTVEMDSVNKHYWKLMEKYAGVEPPLNRPEGAIDFPYKFYFDLEQNHQTKKFVSEVLGYQFYHAFCTKSGQNGELHNCDFFNNLSVGNDLKEMMALGSTKPWSKVLAKIIPKHANLSANGLLEYYTPLLDWLKVKNKESNCKIGWNATKKKII